MTDSTTGVAANLASAFSRVATVKKNLDERVGRPPLDLAPTLNLLTVDLGRVIEAATKKENGSGDLRGHTVLDVAVADLMIDLMKLCSDAALSVPAAIEGRLAQYDASHR